jgi:hypothetical protein
MPLSDPQARERFHTRRYVFDGFRRDDGLWDIDGHMTDVKSYAFHNDYRGEIQAEEPLHDMWIRLTIDEDFVVRDVEAATDAGPFSVCPEVTPNFARMVGVKIGRGWRQAIRERVGGVEGCTHLVEMLNAMATVAFQSLYPVRMKKEQAREPGSRPPIIDSCHAFRSDGEVVKKSWPDFYTGE